MNSTDENHEPISIDDLPTRLVDVALSELVGGNVPPDLSARIVAAKVRQPAAALQAPGTRGNRAFWASLALAIMLLVGVTVALFSDARPARENAQVKVAQAERLGNKEQLATVLLTDGSSPSTSPQSPQEIINSYAASTLKKNIGNQDFESLIDLAESSVVDKSYLGTPQPYSIDLGGPSSSTRSTGTLRLSGSSSASQSGAVAPNSTGSGRLMGGLAVKSGAGVLEEKLRRSPMYKKVAGANLNAAQQIEDSIVPLQTSAADGASNGSLGLHAYINDAQARSKTSQEGTKWSMRTNAPEGSGPDRSGDQYTRIIENPFIKAEGGAAVSTFSIDVDTASYTNVRQFLMEMNQLPPPDAVRIEELINYFTYDYTPPSIDPATGFVIGLDMPPFAAHVEVTTCPWAPDHRLARIGIKGRELDRKKRPQSNLVFLVDVSGSMDEPNKLPLVVYGLEQLTRELGENDRVAIVVYANTEGLVLPSTRGDKQEAILAALAKLKAGGSTAGGAGIQLAYQLAEDNFIKGGTNRVVLCTDGDFNVGVTSTAELERLVEKKAKDTGVFLSVLGFGRGNLNDAMMEAISNHGNGNYHYVDNRTEARRVLVEQMTGTLVTIAKDVKIQVEFNPAQVSGYRLIGYEDRMLRTEDFNDDKKDAGEIGAGHTVTALYEIVPSGKKVEISPVDDLKYQKPVGRTILSVESQSDANEKDRTDRIVRPTDIANELLTLKMRYKAPDGDTSKKLEWPITDDGKAFSAASPDLKFAASVAAFGLLLRNSQYKGNLTYGAVLELAQGGLGEDAHGYRKEFTEMIRKAKELRHE